MFDCEQSLALFRLRHLEMLDTEWTEIGEILAENAAIVSELLATPTAQNKSTDRKNEKHPTDSWKNVSQSEERKPHQRTAHRHYDSLRGRRGTRILNMNRWQPSALYNGARHFRSLSEIPRCDAEIDDAVSDGAHSTDAPFFATSPSIERTENLPLPPRSKKESSSKLLLCIASHIACAELDECEHNKVRDDFPHTEQNRRETVPILLYSVCCTESPTTHKQNFEESPNSVCVNSRNSSRVVVVRSDSCGCSQKGDAAGERNGNSELSRWFARLEIIERNSNRNNRNQKTENVEHKHDNCVVCYCYCYCYCPLALSRISCSTPSTPTTKRVLKSSHCTTAAASAVVMAPRSRQRILTSRKHRLRHRRVQRQWHEDSEHGDPTTSEENRRKSTTEDSNKTTTHREFRERGKQRQSECVSQRQLPHTTRIDANHRTEVNCEELLLNSSCRTESQQSIHTQRALFVRCESVDDLNPNTVSKPWLLWAPVDGPTDEDTFNPNNFACDHPPTPDHNSVQFLVRQFELYEQRQRSQPTVKHLSTPSVSPCCERISPFVPFEICAKNSQVTNTVDLLTRLWPVCALCVGDAFTDSHFQLTSSSSSLSANEIHHVPRDVFLITSNHLHQLSCRSTFSATLSRLRCVYHRSSFTPSSSSTLLPLCFCVALSVHDFDNCPQSEHDKRIHDRQRPLTSSDSSVTSQPRLTATDVPCVNSARCLLLSPQSTSPDHHRKCTKNRHPHPTRHWQQQHHHQQPHHLHHLHFRDCAFVDKVDQFESNNQDKKVEHRERNHQHHQQRHQQYNNKKHRSNLRIGCDTFAKDVVVDVDRLFCSKSSLTDTLVDTELNDAEGDADESECEGDYGSEGGDADFDSLCAHSLVVNRLRSLTQQLRHHSQHSQSSDSSVRSTSPHQSPLPTMKTFDRFKSSKQSSVPRDTGPASLTTVTAGKPPSEAKAGRRIPIPPPPPPSSACSAGSKSVTSMLSPPPPPPPTSCRPRSVVIGSASSTQTATSTKSSPLSIFRRKPKPTSSPSLKDCGENSSVEDSALSPSTTKELKASSSSPPSAEYLQQHRPSCPSVSSTQDLTIEETITQPTKVIMRDNSTKERSKPLSRASYHPNSTTNLLENPNPNSSRERGFGGPPSRASSSFTSSREKDHLSIYPKYCPKRRLRGPYGQMLESKMRNSTDFSDSESSASDPPGLISKLTNGSNWSNFFGSDSVPKLSFTEELLRETRKRRKELDQTTTDKGSPERRSTENNATPSQCEATPSAQISGSEREKPERPKTIALKSAPPSDTKTVTNATQSTIVCENVREPDSTDDIPIVSDKIETFLAPDGVSIMAVIGQHLDTRTHIVGEMYDLEKSYCEFLRSLHEDLVSFEHTKDNENSMKIIDVIAQRLPPALEIHTKFLEQLRRRMMQWAPEAQIGDLFELFRSSAVNDFYEIMVDHLPLFLPVLKQVWKARNNNKNQVRCKIAPEDMLIRLIQRMPQYKTLLDRLLKNTPTDHSDYGALQTAYSLICSILERMNTEQNTPHASLEATLSSSVTEITTPMPLQSLAFPDKITAMRVKDIETAIDGLSLMNFRSDDPVHFFDYVNIGKRKRAIFVLDTCVLICESKRRYKPPTNGNTLRDARFKLEQTIEIEKMDLRCQCWQNYVQQNHHYVSPVSSNSNNNSSAINNNASVAPSPSDAHFSSASMLRITNQLQSTVSTESLATSIGCCSCIETLEADVKTLTKLKAATNEMCSVPIRKLLKDNLNEIQDTVYRQLMTMHTTILNCSLDVNVDIYLVPPCVNHTLTDENLVELIRLFDQHANTVKSSNTEGSATESSNSVDITTVDAIENQTKFRLTHLRCPQHQPSEAPLPASPLVSIAFSCNKKRAYFETVLLCLRAKLFKSRLVLNSVCAMPYDKTRLTLQFRCAGAAYGTNNVWICTSDRGQAQISVLVLSTNNEIEHTIVSCNTVASSHILCISSVPGADCNSEISSSTDHFSSSPVDSTRTQKSPQDASSEPPKPMPNADKLRSNSIQVPAFFQTLKNPKTQSHQSRHSRNHSSAIDVLPSSVLSSSMNSLASPENSTKSGIHPHGSHHPTMWFATADQNLSMYSCFDNIRTGKHKTRIPLDAHVEAIQYFGGRVFVALANSTVAIFHRDATGFWQNEPTTVIENTLCTQMCVVHNATTGREQLWAASVNVVAIRDANFAVVVEAIHMHDAEKIAFMVSDGRTIVLTLVDSCDIYRYSTNAPYQHLCTISIGPFVDKALSNSDQIIRFHKLACLKISVLHAVQNRVWIGTSAGVLLVVDGSNAIHIVPDGFTARVSFIVSTKLDNGQTAVLSGGDGREQFTSTPGNALSTMAGPAELYNFMSYCSTVPVPMTAEHPLPPQSGSLTGAAGLVNNPASISLPNSPLRSTHTPQIIIRRAVASSRTSQLSPSTSSVSRTSDGSMTSGVSSAGTILSCDSIETRELAHHDSPTCSMRLRTGTTNSTSSTLQSFTNTPTSPAQTGSDSEFHPTWGSEDSQSYLLIWKL